MKGNVLSNEDKKVIQEYNDALEFLAEVRDKYKEFDSHKGSKNSANPKRLNTKGKIILYDTFEV